MKFDPYPKDYVERFLRYLQQIKLTSAENGLQIKSEHAVSIGITTGLVFVSGLGMGASILTLGETVLAVLVSIMLGFAPVATLFRQDRRTSPRDNVTDA